MCGSIKNVLKAGGAATIGVAQQMMKEHEELKQKLVVLEQRKQELECRLLSETKQREELERKAQKQEAEIRQLKKAAAEAGTKGTKTPAAQVTARAEDVQACFERQIAALEVALKNAEQKVAEPLLQARRDEQMRFLSGLGTLLDSLYRAVQMSDGVWQQGFKGIRNQFLDFLRGEGVELLGKVGEMMDPRLHESIETVKDSAFEKGQIVHVQRTDFRLADGTVVRPAEVVVVS